MKKNLFKLIFIFILCNVFLFCSPKNSFAFSQINNPGESEHCTSSTGTFKGYNCVSSRDCKNSDGTINDKCSGCTFCNIIGPGAIGYQNYLEKIKQDEVNKSISLPSWTLNIVNDFSYATNYHVVGNLSQASVIGNPPRQAYVVGGALGWLSSKIDSMISTPPASGKEYFADLLHDFNPVKPVYAQGIGFAGLSNLLPLWKAFRDLSYVLFIIIFLIIGLAIMLRVKIDQKTAITVQNAIPKFIMAFLLITFSYAIAGLAIDLIYLIIRVVIMALGPNILGDVPAEMSKYSNLKITEIFGVLMGAGERASTQGFFADIHATLLLVTTVIGGLMGMAGGPIGAIGGAAAGAGAGEALIQAIIGLIVLYAVFKLFFALASAYIAIIVSVITAPIQIAMGVLPGNEGGFGKWFRNLMANVLVFPAVSLFTLLLWLLTAKNFGPDWSPPTLNVAGNALYAIIAFGAIMLIHKIPDMVKEALKSKGPNYGTAIGAILKPATKPFIHYGGEGAKYGVNESAKRLENSEHYNLANALRFVTGVKKQKEKGDPDNPETGAV